MGILTINLTGFDVFLYTLAIAIPVILRHGKHQQKAYNIQLLKTVEHTVALEDLEFSYIDDFELPGLWECADFVGGATDMMTAQPEVIPTTVKPMAIAPQSSITVYPSQDDQTPTDDYEQLSVRQLKALCKELGYTRYSKCSKHELILILRGQNKG